MKKKTIITTILFLVFFSVSQGQITHDKHGQTDKTAIELLKRAVSKMQNVTFTTTMTALDSQKRQLSQQTAEVRYNKGRYHIIASDQELICDGTTVWHWNKNAREVTVNDIPPANDINLLNPSGILASYETNFRAKYIRTEEDGTAIVDLQAKTTRSFHKLRLRIDEKSGILKRLEVHNYDSSREIYDFKKHKFNSIQDSFRFDTKSHPEVEVIDMR